MRPLAHSPYLSPALGRKILCLLHPPPGVLLPLVEALLRFRRLASPGRCASRFYPLEAHLSHTLGE